jgi:alginate O-acetyltransferase complex protein AlgI
MSPLLPVDWSEAMVFSSETFLFLFLPLFLALYYLTPFRFRSALILVGSYLFYGWWRFDFLVLLFLTTLWTYAIGHQVFANIGTHRAKVWCGIGVGGCLAVLGVFKYLNFFIDSFAALFGTTAAGLDIHWRLILPIGVSFYVFHCISYLVDVYRKDAKPPRSFFDFAAFIALFPQLVAGPILRFKDLAHQFERRSHSPQMFADGMARFSVGLGKKVLIADSIAPLADLAFATPDPSAPLAWVGAVAYMLQLYFDFSGYSDMAMGLGLMMGFKFRENFDTPYISASITEFWRRWHISLSVWLRDYLYIPLGGNRISGRRTYVNLLTVMILGGLWHGANWTFVLWGVWHGGWLAAERALGWAMRPRTVGRILLTLLVVLIGWVVFRAPTLTEAGNIYAGMLGLNGFYLPLELTLQITHESLVVLGLAVVIAAAEPAMIQTVQARYYVPSGPGGALAATDTLVPALATSVIFALSVMRLAEQSFSPFLYFQF